MFDVLLFFLGVDVHHHPNGTLQAPWYGNLERIQERDKFHVQAIACGFGWKGGIQIWSYGKNDAA